MSAPTPTSSSADTPVRRWTIAVLLWLYGISITIFLFSIWGRAVAADDELLADAAGRAAGSDLVASRVESWFDEVLSEEGLPGAEGGVSRLIVAVPEVRSATADLVGQLVQATARPSGPQVVIDVAEGYRPAVPAVTSALTGVGIPVSESQVAAVVAQLDPLVIDVDPDRPPVGSRSAAARSLTVATMVALGSMVVSGGGATLACRDRRAMLRSLLNRLAVSGFTYFVFFRISSWVLDPRGGRATVRGGLAEIVGSKLWIPLLVAAVAGGAGWTVRHRQLTHLRDTSLTGS